MDEPIELVHVVVNHGAIYQNEVLRWVATVDNHIEESSIEIMKLGLRTELTQAELDPTTTPSDLYHLLERNYCDSEVLLARFIYALEKLGHRRHGLKAVRELDNFDIEKPKQFIPADIIDPTKLQLFNFYQCLVEVCSHLDPSYYSRLIKLTTKTYLGGRNHKLIKTPCKLFVILLEHRKITKDDQTCLVEVFHIIGAEKYIEYIHLYRHWNNLPEIGDSKYTNASTTSSVTDESSTDPTLRRPGNKGQRPPHHKDLVRKIESIGKSADSSRMDITSRETASRQSNHSDHYQPLRDTQPDGMPTNSSGKSHWKLCCIPFALLSALLLGVLATAMLGIITASHMMNSSNLSLYHDNATVILAELNHFFTGSIKVTQDSAYPGDTDHKIDVHIISSKCSDLPTLELISTHTGSDLSIINKTTLYLLAGSSITYSVCELTSHMNKTGRLEVVILDNLKSTESPENIRNSFHKFAYFSVHKTDEPSCDVVNHSFEANGYYTVIFLSPPYTAHFEYNVTYHIKVIDFTQLSVIANHTLYTDKDSYKFPLDFGVGSSCSIATIKTASTHYIHIQLKMKEHYDFWVKIVLGVVCGLILVISITAILVSICCCRLYFKSVSVDFNNL